MTVDFSRMYAVIELNEMDRFVGIEPRIMGDKLEAWLTGGSMECVNNEVANFRMREDLKAMKNLQAILPGAEPDRLFAGLVDLSAAMGIFGGSEAADAKAPGM